VNDTLFTNVFGPPDTGKTSLAFTHPPPFHYARFDRRADKIIQSVEAFHGEGCVLEETYLWDPFNTDSKGQSYVFLKKFEQQVAKALGLGEGTFIIDGGNRLWDAVQDVKLPWSDDPKEQEAIEKRRRLSYGMANAYLNDILLVLEDSPLNLAIIHHVRPVFDSQGKETDKVKPDYFKRVPYTATAEIFMMSTRPLEVHVPTVRAGMLSANGGGVQVSQKPEFWGLITIFKHDASMEGKMLPNLDFRYLYGLAFGKSYKGGELWSPNGQ